MAANEAVSARKRKALTLDQRVAKRESDRRRAKTRVNLGRSFDKWRQLRELEGFTSDPQLANFLIQGYLRTKKMNPPDQPSSEPSPKRTKGSESCGNMDEEHHYAMIQPDEVKQEASASPIQSSENDKESLKEEEAACQIGDELMTTNQSENENSDVPEDEDGEVSISLSVGDGRYLVDLGSSSEFIIDEECILQLFKTCRECNRQCTVRKQVKGLKIVVSQKCCFCESGCKWTNLPDADDEDVF